MKMLNSIVAKASKNVKRGRGRPAAFETKKAVVAVLRNEANVSYYLKRQLVANGYFTPVAIKADTRGRPAFDYVPTVKARNLLNLAKNWARPVVKNVVETENLDYIHFASVNLNNFEPVGECIYA
jgi:hypothetical protein